jgi:ion channel POLLUX/CASTOR
MAAQFGTAPRFDGDLISWSFEVHPVMRKITLGDRLRYRFDNTLSGGVGPLIGWLALASSILIAAAAIIVIAADIAPASEDGSKPEFSTMVWSTLMHALDAGTVAGDSGGIGYLAAMFVVTLGGIFLVSTLIGILTSGLESKLDQLRKGRSLVCETDHTVILGWSPQIFAIVSELVLANESRKESAIVILAEKDKVEMEDALGERVTWPRHVRLVCRTGSPIDPADLRLVNPNEARAIIVVAPEEGDPDAHVIKTILALVNGPERREGKYHIVAEIRDASNLEAARLVAGDEAQILPVSQLIASITVQTCRQSGLSQVYTELLDFGGDEIYVTEADPNVVGKSFGDALFLYDSATLLGLVRSNGKVELNPPMNKKIKKGDSVIVISEDDSKIRTVRESKDKVDTASIKPKPEREAQKEQILILGWNDRGAAILSELDRYVAPGSAVSIVHNNEDLRSVIEEIGTELENLRVSFDVGDTRSRKTLDRVTVQPYDHVITLAPSNELGPQDADARTLVTLLHLRDIGSKTGRAFSIVSEMLDVRNQKLAEVTRADDFIVSDKLVSLMMTQIAETPALGEVFQELFDPEGSEIYLKPAGDYIEIGKRASFATILESARQRNEVAIGYRLAKDASDVNKSYGVHLNPKKGTEVQFDPTDKVIVLSSG